MLQRLDQPANSGWDHPTSPVEERFDDQLLADASEFIDRWRGVFPSGDTWVGREFGVPSLLIRFDAVRSPSGKLGIYEVEDRPCGAGITRGLNPQFKDNFDRLLHSWPRFRSVRDATRKTDDEHWLDVISLDEALADQDGLFLVRARPEHEEYHPLAARSVSTVSREGDKSYGVALGLWNEVQVLPNPDFAPGGNEPATLIRPEIRKPSVLKPMQGTRCRDVIVYFPRGFEKPAIRGRNEASNENEVLKYLRRHGRMYRQDFIPPMQAVHQPGYNLIYRFYYGFDPRAGAYVPLGGVWAASKDIRVHGTSDTVFGPLIF